MDKMTKVVLYSIGCPKCNVLKRKLEEMKINFEVNSNVEEMKELGFYNLPMMKVIEQIANLNEPSINVYNFSESVKWVNRQ